MLSAGGVQALAVFWHLQIHDVHLIASLHLTLYYKEWTAVHAECRQMIGTADTSQIQTFPTSAVTQDVGKV